MGIVIKFHEKMVRRWKDIFLGLHKKEGKAAAEEWANRTLTPESVEAVAKIIHSKT